MTDCKSRETCLTIQRNQPFLSRLGVLRKKRFPVYASFCSFARIGTLPTASLT